MLGIASGETLLGPAAQPLGMGAGVRVFLDVGAHYGETLEVALDPRWGFGRIFAFEPAAPCQRILGAYRDRRLGVVPRGLSDRSGTTTLFGTGSLGASVYADKQQLGSSGQTQSIQLERATDWIRDHTLPSDEIYLKLNCEGSECDVLDDLLDSGLIKRVRSVYVDFDIRKVPSQAHRQAEVETRLREAGTDFSTPETLGSGTNLGVRRWLSATCHPIDVPAGERWRYAVRLHRPTYMWGKYAAETILPRGLFQAVARRFGAHGRST